MPASSLPRPRRIGFALALAAGVIVAACEAGTPADPVDAGSGVDAAVFDAGLGPDAEVPPDAGERPDASAAPDAGPVSLTLSPATGQAAPAGPPIRFTATLENSSDPVLWTLDGPGRIDPRTGPATTYTPPPCLEVAATASVRAAAAGQVATASVAVDAAACHVVRGAALDIEGRPVAGVSVLVSGHPVVTSDANGAFEVADVAVPYDLAVLRPGSPDAIVVTGLRRTDPVLRAPNPAQPAPSTARISGAVTGLAANPLPQDRRFAVQFDAPGATSGSHWLSSAGYSIDVTWSGSSSVTGTLHALEWQLDPNTGMPIAYKYGSRAGVTVTNASALTLQDVNLAAIGTSTFSGAVTVADGYFLAQRTSSVALGPGAVFPVADEQFGASALLSTFSALLPTLPDATARLDVRARSLTTKGAASLSRSGLALDSGGLSFTLPAAAVLAEPADRATGVGASTAFRWAGGSGVAMLMLDVDNGPGQNISVVTTEHAATVPDLSPLGVRLTPSTKYMWRVVNLIDLAATDDFAAATFGGGDLSTTASGGRNFWTGE